MDKEHWIRLLKAWSIGIFLIPEEKRFEFFVENNLFPEFAIWQFKYPDEEEFNTTLKGLCWGSNGGVLYDYARIDRTTKNKILP